MCIHLNVTPKWLEWEEKFGFEIVREVYFDDKSKVCGPKCALTEKNEPIKKATTLSV